MLDYMKTCLFQLRLLTLLSCTLLASLFYVTSAIADDLITETFTNTAGISQSQLNVVVDGNVAGDITTLNPFGPSGSVSSSYNGVSDQTTFSFTGTAVPTLGSVTVGLDDSASGITPWPHVVGNYWGTSPSSGLQLPAPYFAPTFSGSGSSSGYLIIYAQFMLNNITTDNEWFEAPMSSGQTASFAIGNTDITNTPLFAFNVGFQFSNTEIPLDDLNLQDYPSSSFTPVPGISNDERIDDPGDINSGPIDVPEPASVLLVVPGVAGWLIRRRWMSGKTWLKHFVRRPSSA